MIQLKTKIPGPESQRLFDIRTKNVVSCVTHMTPIFVKRAHGTLIEDVDGNTFLDFASGIAVTNVGHTNEAVVAAIEAQLQHHLHLSFNVTLYEGYVRLAERLNQITPGGFLKKTYLANTGAEAVENAIKVARRYTGKQAVICFEHAFHGRTYMAMTLTAKSMPYKYGFEPFCGEVYRTPLPYAYRGETTETCFEHFKDLVNSQLSADRVAAVIIEPVCGEGGFIPVPQDFLRRLQEFCAANKIVFIVDEIQTGFGRTGSLFACNQLGIEPDLITMAKGLGGGLPISALTGRAEMMDSVHDGGLGGTYNGNPLSCAAALAVIQQFEDGKLLSHIQEIGKLIETKLEDLKSKFSRIGDVRGLGPMRALELVKDRKTKEPDKERAKAIIKGCAEHGLVLMTAGSYSNCVRLLPPLVITKAQVDEGFKVLEAALSEVCS